MPLPTHIYILYILGVARYMYSYRTVTVQASRFGAWDLTTNTSIVDFFFFFMLYRNRIEPWPPNRGTYRTVTSVYRATSNIYILYIYIYIHTVAVFSWNEHYRGSKTTNCILSNTNYDYRGRLIKTFLQFLAKYYIMASEHFYHGAWFLNQEILIVASHIQLHIYDFSKIGKLAR